MSLYLHFLRHGETTHSRTGGYCGWLDPELTASGVQMAQSFAEAYRELVWEAVFCSPMKRTMATARPLCEAVGIEPQLRDGLREMSYGKWEDKRPEYVQKHFGEDYVRWQREPAWNSPTSGETALQVSSRASLVIAEIEERYPSGNVLVVCHKTTIRIVLCSLLGIDLGRYRDRIDMPVATVSVVRFDKYGPMLMKMGDRAHLSEALRNRKGT